MARPTAPHFVGFFGAVFPLVMESIKEQRIPTAFSRVRPEYRGPLIGSLACDLTSRSVPIILWGQEHNWLVFAKAAIREELGGTRYRAVQRDLEECDREMNLLYEQRKELENRPHDVEPLVVTELNKCSARERRLRLKVATLSATRDRLSAEIEAVPEFRRLLAKHAERDGRCNGRLNYGTDVIRSFHDGGAPYYLRNTDFGWWMYFQLSMRRRVRHEAVRRWFALRDPENVQAIAGLNYELFADFDKNMAELLTILTSLSAAEGLEWELRPSDVHPKNINSTRATLRAQDDSSLQWLDELGKRENPYTRWLAALPCPESSLRRDWLEARLSRYVPKALRMGDDEMENAKLCWVLSRINPVVYPYTPFFFDEYHRKGGERLLAEWWKKVSAP